MYRIWYSTESFADYIIEHTYLAHENIVKEKLSESDASKPRTFHAIPDHIRKILYLDAPDLIIEKDNEPVLSIEETKEAGTGHNAFQRFARIAAAVENGVPAFYVYPEAVIISRKGTNPRWDSINPAVFSALEATMSIYGIPAFLFYYPSDFTTYRNQPEAAPNLTQKGLKHDAHIMSCPDAQDDEMQTMFSLINEILNELKHKNVREVQRNLLQKIPFRNRRAKMQRALCDKAADRDCTAMSPLTATRKIPTQQLLDYLSQYESKDYHVGSLLRERKETIVYQVNAKFRGDPYPGALAAIDYMLCREGRTFEDRRYNLILFFGEMSDNQEKIEFACSRASIQDFFNSVKSSSCHNLLTKNYEDLSPHEIPRYFMQVRYGSTYSKVKHIRVFSYFADAVLFSDGALWRDA